MTPETATQEFTLKALVLYFLKLGTTGFGGPVALTNYMERDLVEDKKWIKKEEFIEGLALSQLAPGPLAAQLAIYLGWVRGGTKGATLAGIAFILPSFLICVVLAIAYLRFGELPWIQSLFYSVGAAVIAIIVNSARKLVGKTVGKDYLLLSIWGASGLFTAWSEAENLWIFLGAGLLSLLVRVGFKITAGAASIAFVPAWLSTGLSGPAQPDVLWDIAKFFTKAGAFVFGSGLAIVPFLYGGVVQEFHWLNERQFIDAVAVAMITPGPVVITVAFIGYLAAGIAGASVAALATFLPCYLLTVLPAPYYSRFAKNRKIKAFVEGVTAAAVGAIAGATWVLGKRAIIDIPTLLIALTTLAILVKTKIPEPLLIVIAAITGLLLKGI